LPLFCRWESFVNDATFAFKFLASRPKIDSDSVGIFGHSEGGSIALDVSQNQKFDAPAPKLLILAATAGRSLGDIISEQICAILSHQKAEPQAREFFLKENRRIQKAILATGKVPSDVPSGLRIFYPDYIGPFLKSALALDTPTLASSFSGPILVINGMADTQVSAERDAGLFAKILSNRSDGSEVYLPTDVSHNLKHINGNPQGFDGDLDGRVKDKVLSWLKDILQPLISR
jgi:dienelactone hydrolase